jgi:hypothetical protein
VQRGSASSSFPIFADAKAEGINLKRFNQQDLPTDIFVKFNMYTRGRAQIVRNLNLGETTRTQLTHSVLLSFKLISYL